MSGFSDFLPDTLPDPLARTARAMRALRIKLSKLPSRPCECEHCEHSEAFSPPERGVTFVTFGPRTRPARLACSNRTLSDSKRRLSFSHKGLAGPAFVHVPATHSALTPRRSRARSAGCPG